MSDRSEEVVLSQEFAQELLREVEFLPEEVEDTIIDSHRLLVYKLKKINKITDDILDNIKHEEGKRLSSHT